MYRILATIVIGTLIMMIILIGSLQWADILLWNVTFISRSLFCQTKMTIRVEAISFTWQPCQLNIRFLIFSYTYQIQLISEENYKIWIWILVDQLQIEAHGLKNANINRSYSSEVKLRFNMTKRQYSYHGLQSVYSHTRANHRIQDICEPNRAWYATD